MGNFFGDILDAVGTGFDAPELGLSEIFGGGKTANTGRVDFNKDVAANIYGNRGAQNLKRNYVKAATSDGGASGSWGTPVKVERPAYDGENIPLESTYTGGGGGGGGGGTGGSGYTAADERLLYDDQISSLDRLLAGIGVQTNAGLDNLRNSLGSQKQRLNEQKMRTMSGYDEQSLENAQEKQRGVEQVDQYANQNYNSLQRLLAGANAGSSSVARELIPYLVSKSAGTRRTNVFDTAGKNEQSIVKARGNAEDEYGYANEDLDNQAKQQEQSFRQGVINQENDLLAKKQQAMMSRSMANGSGYAAARAGAQGVQNEINSRQDQLNSLFSQFKPTFASKAMNLQKPELGKYTVDRAQVNADRSLPAESSYYQTQLRKKQQELA